MRDLLPNPTHLVDTLWRDLDAPGGYDDIECDIVVEVDPGVDSFYYYSMTVYFPVPHSDALGRSHGIAYAGFQTNGHAGVHDDHVGKMAIFSIWDGTRGIPASNGWATPFVENGTGFSVRAPFDWQEGIPYRVRIARGEIVDGERLWEASLKDLDGGTTTPIGAIAVPTGMGGVRGPITFHERYGGPSATVDDVEPSRAVFRDVAASGRSVRSRAWENIHVAKPAGAPDLVWAEDVEGGVRSGVGARGGAGHPG